MVSPPPYRISSTGPTAFHNMPPLLPRESICATSVISAHIQRPSPVDHRIGNSNSFTRLHLGSLALRPAILPIENLRPLITQTPLSWTTKVYGQLLGRDFNPLGRSVVTANGRVLNPSIQNLISSRSEAYCINSIRITCDNIKSLFSLLPVKRKPQIKFQFPTLFK